MPEKSAICKKCGGAKPPFGHCLVCYPRRHTGKVGRPKQYSGKGIDYEKNKAKLPARQKRHKIRLRNRTIIEAGELLKKIYQLLEQDTTTGEVVLYQDRQADAIQVKAAIPLLLAKMAKVFQWEQPRKKRNGPQWDPVDNGPLV